MRTASQIIDLKCSARLARRLWPEASVGPTRQVASIVGRYVSDVAFLRVWPAEQAAFLVPLDPDAFRMA